MLRGSEDHNMSEFTVLTAYTSSTKTQAYGKDGGGCGGGGGGGHCLPEGGC